MLSKILLYIQSLDWVPAAVFGGLVDYLAKVKTDRRHCTFLESITHAISALFFGWLLGEMSIASGLVRIDPIMTQEQVSEVMSGYMVAVALGGLYGKRIGEVILFAVKKRIGMDD